MTARDFLRIVALAAAVAGVADVPAFAHAAVAALKERALGTFGAWHAYVYNEGGQTVCYMVTTKLIKPTDARKRADPYLMITHRPIEASTDVVSYGAGLRLDSWRDVTIRIDQSRFDLFSVRDTAWTRDAQTDHRLAAAIRSARLARITGFPGKKGAKKITDQFNLSGAAAAYRAIGRACGLLPDIPRKPTIPRRHRRRT